MTLALYGKSKPRQASLIGLGLTAVLLGTFLALWAASLASAHVKSASADCDEVTVAFTKFASGTNSARVRIWVDDVGPTTYYPQWSGDSYNFQQSVSPINKVSVEVDWGPGIGVGTSDNDSHNGAKEDFTGLSCRETTIIVKKVVESGDPSTAFYVDIDNHTNEPDKLDAKFDVNNPLTYTFAPDPADDTEDDYTITEHLPPTGWALTGVKVFEGSDHSCDEINWDAADNDHRSVEATLDHGTTHTVCFRNKYTDPKVTIHVAKVECLSGTYPLNFARPISATTASSFASQTAGCDVAAGWNFEYNAGNGWVAFSNPTDASGNTSEEIAISEDQTVKVREVFDGDYAFKQLSCHNDVGGEVDNEDWIEHVSSGGDYYCVAINQPNAGTVGVDKSQSGDGSYDVGEQFDFTITFNVSGGVTTAVNTATDDVPATFDIISVAGPHEGGITCNKTGQQVNCDLPAGTTAGSYAATLTVAPNSTATCGEITNYATISGTNADTNDNGDETVSINCASVVATKIVCPNESYFPDAADGSGADGVGEPITSTTAANFLTANPACSLVPWTFEYGWDVSNPGDNLADSGLVNFNGTLSNFLIRHDETLWIREQKLADYIDFYGQVTSTPEFSAEMYCSADVLHYDNWERIESTSGASDIVAGQTYYCVAFNTLSEGEIDNVKIVTNVDEDTTDFTAGIAGTESFTSSPFHEAGDNYAADKASPGYYTATEIEEPGYRHVETYVGYWDGGPICERKAPEVSENAIVAEGYELEAGGHLVFCHVNEAVGTVVLIKNETHRSDAAEDWDFSSTILNDPTLETAANPTAGLQSDDQTFENVPVGSYSISELQGESICASGDTSDDYQTQALAAIGSAPNPSPVTDVIGNGSLNFEVQVGQTTYIVFENQGCGTVLAAANIIVRKWEDIEADYVGEALLDGWTITITGTGGAAAGFGPVSQDTESGGVAAFLGVPDGTYTIQETPKVTHTVVGSDWLLNGIPNGSHETSGAAVSGLSVALDQTLNVDFFNQPKGRIIVEKTVIDNVGSVGAGGWQFNLSGCGVFKTDSTDATGMLVFDNLVPCANYLVTEVAANANGFATSPSGTQSVDIAPGDEETVSFLNRRDPGSTPETSTTPTNTPEDTDETPTETPPADATDTPTPVETVAGEKTPGPGNEATPIAPNSGSGLASGSTGGSVLLALLGFAVLTGGASLMAVSRKRR